MYKAQGEILIVFFFSSREMSHNYQRLWRALNPSFFLLLCINIFAFVHGYFCLSPFSLENRKLKQELVLTVYMEGEIPRQWDWRKRGVDREGCEAMHSHVLQHCPLLYTNHTNKSIARQVHLFGYAWLFRWALWIKHSTDNSMEE